MLVRAHRTLGQPQHIAFFVMQGYGMHARRFDSSAHLLANGIEVDERTVRCAERLALLHRFDAFRGSVYIYRTVANPGVMVFAKMRQIL
jgi:hypothetical protein